MPVCSEGGEGTISRMCVQSNIYDFILMSVAFGGLLCWTVVCVPLVGEGTISRMGVQSNICDCVPNIWGNQIDGQMSVGNCLSKDYH